MLLRMYLRWAERRGFGAEITDQARGRRGRHQDRHGRDRWIVRVRPSEGRSAACIASCEISPFDSSARRHTSFALIEVMPIFDEDPDIEIRPDDVKMDVYRSGGAGGQHMQKNSTAVRLTHTPTGIVVTCQNERNQLQNRESAMPCCAASSSISSSRRRKKRRRACAASTWRPAGATRSRSYVLQPYQMVKDLRTEYEVGNPATVLDGEIDAFIEAWLKDQVGSELN